MFSGERAASVRVYAVLLLLVVLSWWWSRSVEPIRDEALIVSGQQIDYFAEQMTISEMNEGGALKHQLVADRITHYTGSGRSQLKNPVVMLYDPPHQPWRISADTGIVFVEGDRVVLEGSVYISRRGSSDELPVNIRTEWLEVLPDESSAYTDKNITMISSFDHIDGVGMRVRFDNDVVVSILSKVRSKHESQ